MNGKASLTLVVLAGAAALWFFKADKWGPHIGIRPANPERARSEAVGMLEALSPQRITKVEIAFPNGEPLVLERAATDAEWRLPGNWPLRRPEVEELVETLGTLCSRFHGIPLAEETAFDQYGLAPNQKPLVVKLTTDRQLFSLTFGQPKQDPSETDFTRPAYVRINDSPEVLRLGPDVWRVVRRPSESYRRRALFPDVERIKLAGAAGANPFGTAAGGDAASTVTLPGEDVESIHVARTIPRIWNLDLSPGYTFSLVRTGRLPEPAIIVKGGEPVVPPDRLADAWSLASPGRDRVEPAHLRGVLTAVTDLWVDSFSNAVALDVRLAAGRMLITPLDPLSGIGRLCPLPPEVRTGLAQSSESVKVIRRSGESVIVRFGGVAKVAEHEEMISLPGGPPGSPQRSIPNKVHKLYRFARVDGNPQIFTVAAEKLADLFASVPALADPRVAHFDRDEIREVVIRPARQPEIRLSLTKGDSKGPKPEEKQNRWFLDAKPNPLLADTGRVNELLDRLSGLRAEGEDQKLFPHDPPAAEIRVTIVTRDKRPVGEQDGPRRELTLLIGKPNHATRRLPVRLEGWPRVTLVDNTLSPQGADSWITGLLFPNTVSDLLNRPALTYRNRKLFDAAAQLAAVSVTDKFALQLESNEWKLTAPIVSDADPGKAGELATALTGLGATEYLTEKPTEDELRFFGLDVPAHTVHLEFNGTRSFKLELGSGRPGKEEVFARLDGGAVFGLPSSVVDHLTTGVLGLLPLRIWAAQTEKIEFLEIARQDAPRESFKLAQDGSNWWLSGPFTAPVPRSSAQSLLSALGNLNAVKYQALSSANPAEYGFDRPLLTIRIGYSEAKQSASGEVQVAKTLVVGGPIPDGSGRFARLDTPNAPVFIAPAAFFEAAKTSPLDLLDRALLNLDSTRLTRVRVAPEGSEADFALTKDGTGKWAADGVTFSVDPERITRLTSTAARLPVMKIAAYGDDVKWADFGLDKPVVSVAITCAGITPETHTIALGKADPLGWRYARVDGGKAVAVIPAAAADALSRKKFEYADRTLLTFDPATLVGFSRRKGNDELDLAPAASIGWDIVKPDKQKADQPFMDELADTLSRLRAERVAAYGKREQLFKEYGLEPPAATITLAVGERTEQKKLRIGNYVNSVALDGDRFATVESPNAEVIVGVLPAVLVNKLLAEPIAFRDRSLAKFVDADRAVLESGDRTVTFAKFGATWKVVEPIATATESAELEALVADLGRLRADTWVAEKKSADLKLFGLDRPEVKWTFSNGDATVLILLLGKRTTDGRVHATTDKAELIGLLDRSLTTRVMAEYRKRKPWDVDVAQVTEIEIAAAGGTFRLEKAGATWTDPTKTDDPINAVEVTGLLGTIGGLRVERYALDHNADPKLFGLGKPEVTLTVTAGAARHVLELGGVVGGTRGKQRYARVVEKERSDVFVLSEADTLRLTRDRSEYLMKK